LGAPGEHAVDSVDVDGTLSQAVQQELLVDNVLSYYDNKKYAEDAHEYKIMAKLQSKFYILI
jgi:hypothetical protein